MTQETESQTELSSRALMLMEKHYVAPSPENYATWFHYASGKNKELAREIDNMIQNALPFIPSACTSLYSTYVMPDRDRKVIDAAAGSAQKVLQEVLNIIGEFSDETKTYNQGVDQYVEHISHKFKGTGVEHLVKELVTATVGLKKSGEKISRKFEKSKQEIDSLKKNLHEVTSEAQRDFLTGTYNRKAFEALFEEISAISREKHSELCLIMLDIDHFKQFNDKFGHLLGDEVLKIVAHTLTDTLKGRDVVARFGGEEFVVLLPDTPLEGAMKVAEMIRTGIASKELKRKDTGAHFGTITVSMGISRLRRDGDSLASLIKRADDALYQAKHRGRNCVMQEAQ